MSAQPLFIDIETRKRLHQFVAEDFSYLMTGNTSHSPSYTFHHIQKHIKARCPTVIESGRDIAATRKDLVNELKDDTVFTLQQLEGMRAASDEFRMATGALKQRIDAIYSR